MRSGKKRMKNSDHEESSNGGRNFGGDCPKINMENTKSKITARRQIFTQNNGKYKNGNCTKTGRCR